MMPATLSPAQERVLKGNLTMKGGSTCFSGSFTAGFASFECDAATTGALCSVFDCAPRSRSRRPRELVPFRDFPGVFFFFLCLGLVMLPNSVSRSLLRHS